MSDVEVPVYQEYMNPLVEVLKAEGRALSIEELETKIIARMQLPPAVVAVPHDPAAPDRSEVGYRIAWGQHTG